MDRSVKIALTRSLRQALQRKNTREAERILDRLKIEDPVSVETCGFEFEILLASQQWDRAQRFSEQALQRFPTSARVRFLAGKLAYRQKNYKAALQHFEESKRLYPHWRSNHWLARTLTQLGHLDAAEPILLDIAPNHPHCRSDLAWLYERKKDYDRALEQVTAYLKVYPNHERIKEQEARLRAHQMDTADVIGEVDMLSDLDQEIPEAILPQYIEGLLTTGKGKLARSFVQSKKDSLSERVLAQLAWICFRLHAHDMAFELFLLALTENFTNVKFLTSLEKTAALLGRTDELVDAYERYAPDQKNLYGRIKNLQRLIQSKG
ncbi:MAG: tetratricopeptide repeat protein [Myxococcota bacterium]|nr:tetratricopeptide repeat protein [Myxococcota bacterium]